MSLQNNGPGKQGVLAARQAIPEPQHPRVTEPLAKSVLERLSRPSAPTVSGDATVLDALKVMTERDVSAVAVLLPDGLIKIFSERNYARNCLPKDCTAANTPVAELMSQCEATVAPGDSVRHCLALMNERQLSHLAVLEQGQLTGLLSKEDLLAAQISYYERIFHEIEMDQKLLFLRGTYSC